MVTSTQHSTKQHKSVANVQGQQKNQSGENKALEIFYLQSFYISTLLVMGFTGYSPRSKTTPPKNMHGSQHVTQCQPNGKENMET